MRMRITLCALAALSLAACQKKASVSDGSVQRTPAAEATAAEPAAQIIAPALSIPQLAYAYRYALAAPPTEVRRLISKHEAMCWAAGPTFCQVIGSTVAEDGPDRIAATLSLQAQPAWLRQFRLGLEDDTRAAGGRMTSADTMSDDLSRNLVDTEAALRAKTILRDRLQETLRTRSGKIQDFFEMEQKLAEVQGQIDATSSELATMRTRVATSQLRIDYQSEGVLAPGGSFAPVAAAATDVVGLFMMTLAFLIRALAVLVPVVGVGGVFWWLIRPRLGRKTRVTAA